ncbi:cutinase, partial [Rhodococcus oxybenzonivorans]|nr:cutinase [Rhodococcus oxybenzonivorans]
DIQSQENWMQSDETFLDVLIKVSDPAYKPGTPVAQSDTSAGPLSPNQAIDLVYLPAKVRNEIIGFIADNENTVAVVMSDPYQQTLGPGTGHHFDYWRDADPAGGKALTSSQYAAAWLTHLARQAEMGQPAADASAAALVASSDSAADPSDTASTTSTTSIVTKDLLSSTDSSTAPTTTSSAVPTAAPLAPTVAVVTPDTSAAFSEEPSPSAAVAATDTPSTQQEVPTTVEVAEPEATTIPTTTTVPPSPVQ